MTVDPELAAIRRLVAILEDLEAGSQERVLTYLRSRYPEPAKEGTE